nr:hypothetical protein [Tanacetum cinerariifolium]
MTPSPLTSPLPAPSQPSKQTSTLSINLEPIELIFSTPPISSHPFFDSLEDLPPWTANLPPPQPSFDTNDPLANQPPPLPSMEPPLLPFPSHLQHLGSNNAFPILTHKMFCEHCQRTGGVENISSMGSKLIDKVESVIYQAYGVLMIEDKGFEPIVPSFSCLFKTIKSLFEFEYMSDSEEEDGSKKDEICLIELNSNEVCFSILGVLPPPPAGEAVTWPAEGTSLVVKLALVKLEALLEVLIECSPVQQPRISLISPDNSVNFEGSSFSLVGKQLTKLCEAKSLESSGFREVTRRLFLVPSSISCYEDMESLGADDQGSTSATESAEASYVGPPATRCASLCISPTTGVGGEGWLGLLSLAELDLVFVYDWPVLVLDALVWDSDVCFEDCFLLGPFLALCFFPWGTSSVCEEGFGALKTTGTSNLQIAFMWVVKRGSSDNSVNFEGSSFSLVGKQLTKLCEAKSLESSGFREVTRRLFLVPSSISCYEDMESLGADDQGSTSATESAEASCPDADSECK